MTNPPRILVVAGEASGDTHAAELVAALRARRPDLTFFGMGGARLAAQGVELLFDAREVSVMGITEVLPRIPRILQILKGLAEAAAERKPDVAILVDIPDFNLRLAKKLKALGVPVAYYVSPMIWAWRRGRVRTIKRLVDRMLCILPFEEDFYREAGVSARYVGSPVVEQVPSPDTATAFRERLGLSKDAPTLALLPGSRMGEIRRLLPDMVEAAKRLSAERPGLQVVVPLAPTIDREEITSRFEGSGVTPILVEGRAPEVVGASDAAVVASGTAVLEAGLMQRPLVVVYRVSLITYWVGRLMLKVAFVSLINLLAGRRVVPELLQGEMTPERIAEEVRRVWIPGAPREEMLQGLAEMRGRLGETGAATRAAESVLELLPPGRV
ncbi:lipid-A-disaccharide synthase [Myxococcus xanthus DK 1622]|uniref:Lipid-A-disaccharide synthase n=1 Tax=Myxococcus xanthus (strain DK1622) TaxID=246197 RepID=LPXB_MYXXD|nr:MULTISPECIES: lipid-A-disaccharide synthase [Myxococcus]Q1D393.1 RecName: Full=Lipid-A-disaccharide synthase [Myxococcus xanthus DK 1622]ABF90745.1 lipid-A-disaccharide synthase [Myxococcus xanthus DK 1622]NOJ52460.1 lipid-A-disaccharide synthase [Myxococcus xanthus]QPM77268.1 lipid-A-disaccharide synthase [Myxococcus xanthus]QQR42148.1 lipid-A-disaccharide synthase [Myxococcus xanthus]QVW66337.1 lipid-A-disaccharide synthase [Myxococcus xanthus DZ2]